VKKTAILLLCLFFVFAGCTAKDIEIDVPENTSTETLAIRVLSFNIRTCTVSSDKYDEWDTRKEGVYTVIGTVSPDVFGVQEARMNVHVKDLKKTLTEYACIARGREKTDSGESCAVFYKKDKFDLLDEGTFWLSATPEGYSIYQAEDGEQAACPRICTFAVLREKSTQKVFVFMNTHLDHKSEKARIFAADLILEKMKGDYCILTGDFNTTSDSAAYQKIRSVLSDTRITATETASGKTFHAYNGGVEGTPIDFIFTTQNISATKFCIEREKYNGYYPSDHYAIWADINF